MRKYRFSPLVTSYAKCYKPTNSAVQLHTLRHPHTHHTLSQSHSTRPGHDTTPAPTQPHPLKISRAARKLLPGFWLQLRTVTSTDSGREHSAKLLLRVLRVPRDPAPSPQPTAGANPTTRASPAEGSRQRHQPKPPETQPQRRYMQATHSQVHRPGQQRAPVMSQSTGAPRRTRGPT